MGVEQVPAPFVRQAETCRPDECASGLTWRALRLAAGPHQGGSQFLAAADAELVEDRPQVLLDGVLADGQLADDLLGGVSPQHEREAGSCAGYGTSTTACSRQGAELAG